MGRRRDIVFIGGFDHAPTSTPSSTSPEIFPRVQERIPEAVFQVIGPASDAGDLRLASPQHSYPGLRRRTSNRSSINARVSVAPLRFGAGVKGKVNQSMSFGVPTVVTSIAAEGMYLTHELDAMIADDPERFADAVVRLWTSPELWRTVSQNGLRNLARTFLGRGCREAHRRASRLGRPVRGNARMTKRARP